MLRMGLGSRLYLWRGLRDYGPRRSSVKSAFGNTRYCARRGVVDILDRSNAVLCFHGFHATPLAPVKAKDRYLFQPRSLLKPTVDSNRVVSFLCLLGEIEGKGSWGVPKVVSRRRLLLARIPTKNVYTVSDFSLALGRGNVKVDARRGVYYRGPEFWEEFRYFQT